MERKLNFFFWSDIVRDCNLKGAAVNCTQCTTINEPSIGRLYNIVGIMEKVNDKNYNEHIVSVLV